MKLLDAFLNKGGAGRSLSRHASAERLDPVLRRHVALNLDYDAALHHLGDADAAARLRPLLKTARADAGKLRETVLSMGHVAYTGTDLEPETIRPEGDDEAILQVLQDRERDFLDAVRAELELKRPDRHHIRTMAIIETVRAHSEERLEALDQLLRSRRPTRV